MRGRRILQNEKIFSPQGLWNETVTTQIVSSSDPLVVPSAAAAIARGDLLILPTDTVYGIGTSAFDEQAIQRLYSAKNRSVDKGIPILIADQLDLEKLASEIPAIAESLIERFWPGPLTIVFHKRKSLPASLSQTDSIAVRMPDHELAREIIRAGGGALAATSANRSGKAPALTVREALCELAGAVALAIDDGPSAGGAASTVIDCTTNAIRELRAGPIALEVLLKVGRS